MGPKPLKSKKARKVFIHDILGKAFDIGFSSYWVAFDQKNHDKMKYFEGECQNLSKVGLQVAKMCFGQEHSKIKELKEVNQDFENWFKKNHWKSLEDESNNLHKEVM